MAPQGAAYHVDWIVSNHCNVHVAAHRDWFSDYREFPSKVTSNAGYRVMDVLGIGTVILDLQPPAEESGQPDQHQITLRNVLYVPTAVTNIVAACLMKDYLFQLAGDRTPLYQASGKVIVGYIALNLFWRLWLQGQHERQTSVVPGTRFLFCVYWSQKEKSRFHGLHNAGRLTDVTSLSRNVATMSRILPQKKLIPPPYTIAEKDFLKASFGDELHFLRMYQLSIAKEEDRGEGRQRLRALMTDRDSEDYDTADSLDVDGHHLLADLEDNPAAHVTDHLFSDKELDWIREHYNHSRLFFICRGLKLTKYEDRLHAVQIVRKMVQGCHDKGADLGACAL